MDLLTYSGRRLSAAALQSLVPVPAAAKRCLNTSQGLFLLAAVSNQVQSTTATQDKKAFSLLLILYTVNRYCSNAYMPVTSSRKNTIKANTGALLCGALFSIVFVVLSCTPLLDLL